MQMVRHVRFVLEDLLDGQVELKVGSCVVRIETIMPRGKRIPGRACQSVREPLDEHGLARRYRDKSKFVAGIFK